MAVKLPKAGKRYRYTDLEEAPKGMEFLAKDRGFTVTKMTPSGAVVTDDAVFCGEAGTWCVAGLIDRPFLEQIKTEK